jgi:NADPH2:quinone reductase
VETQIRAGRPPHAAMHPRLPVVLGNGVGGVVAAVGPGVDSALLGRRVVGSLDGRGGYAERAATAAMASVEVPAGLAMRDAVALLADGRTALHALRQVELAAGERVLILPAGGGVGTLLVQLARERGAGVLAGAGGTDKLELARSLGAEDAADYRRPGWSDGIDGVDVVIDGVGGAVGRAAFERLRRGGRLLRLGMASGAFAAVAPGDAAARGVTLVEGPRPTPEALASLTRETLELAAGGRVRPIVGQTFPLARAADAHAAIEARRTLGKTLLVVR